MNEILASDATFTNPQRSVLAALSGLMIPADAEMPSAAERTIFADIIRTLQPAVHAVADGLERLEDICKTRSPTEFAELPVDTQLELIAELRDADASFVQYFERTVLACYYRDDRVLNALGLPARAPWPVGNSVADTDWSLLEPVRQRTPFYRST